MTENLQIAAIFRTIADLLEIKGENPFKARAYRRAADRLEGLSEPVSALIPQGKLRQLDGIGEAIAKKIEEFVSTGRLAYYENLKAEVPPGLLEILDIPGVGPRTARKIHLSLGISGIDALEAAAKAGKIRHLPGMGVKTEQNILHGIQLLRGKTGRIPIGMALPAAVGLEEAIKKLHGVEEARVAGSIRRMKETAGDIDVVIATTDPAAILQSIVKLEPIRETLSLGDTRARVMTREGIEADLWAVKPAEFYAALHHATGSKAHNVRLRTLAHEHGLKLNEYGLFREDGAKISINHEEDIYEILGLEYIIPEMREDSGEIEAALDHSLPITIDPLDIKGDLHMHTNWSDGISTIEEMVEAARRRGYSYLAICDHSKSLGIARGLSDEDIMKQADYIRRLNDRIHGIRVLAGIEVDIRKDGTLDYPDEILSQLDIVVASIHSGFRQEKDIMTQRIITAIRNKNVDILAHPTGRLLGRREPYDVDMEAVLREAAASGTILEINSYPDRLDLSDIWARRAAGYGIKISIDTDAHAPDQLSYIAFGVSVARRAWLTTENVVNSWPYEKLKTYLDKTISE
ncbi:MAG TPA: DNA polymerase/3'-5' exonuclease PolX [Firmicutes bacterium]|nr:DNA polymerase/3'-5' exonuclease PolX [Bacillota bacterium]